MAKGLEGLRRQDGIHAAAVVITKDPLTEYLPIQRKPETGQAPEDAPVVTQYEMHGVEELGLLKMDFLGLRNLDVISDTVELIRARHGPAARHRRHPPRRRPHARAAAPGRLDRRVPARGRPHARADALAGPDVASTTSPPSSRSTGRARWRPTCTTTTPTARTAASRSRTSTPTWRRCWATPTGLMIYQESVMRVAQKFAGYSLAEADNLRKACGKKIRELIAAEREKFVAGCERTGYGAELGTQLFDIIEPFADYAFNKSHAYGYGFVAYQTAYLKAHYPVEYLACLLTSVKANLDKAAVYLTECRGHGHPGARPRRQRVGVRLRRPRPDERRRPELPPAAGRHPVRAVGRAQRGRGPGRADRRASARRTAPSPTSTTSCDRVDFDGAQQAHDRVADQGRRLRLAGPPPPGPAAVYELIIDQTVARRRKEAEGQFDLFAGLGDGRRPSSTTGSTIPDVEFDKAERLAFEKEMLGLYVSDHPLMGAEAALRRRTDCTIAELAEREDGTDGHRRRPRHQPAAQVDQEGRPHGRLRARGPADARSRSWSSRRRCPTTATSSQTTPSWREGPGRRARRDAQADVPGAHGARGHRRRRPAAAPQAAGARA